MLLCLAVACIFNTPAFVFATDLKANEQQTIDKLNTFKEELAQNVANIENVTADMELQKNDLASAEEDLQAQSDSMHTQIKYIYENDTLSVLDIIFQSKSLADFIANIEYVQAVAEYNDNMLKAYQASYSEVVEKGKSLQMKH